MTLEQLRIFLAVAECEHVTHASYALDMVQSAVSKSIATLEGEIQIRLFDRVGRNIKLSNLGAAFREQACELLEHAEQVRSWTLEAGARGRSATIVCAIPFTANAASGTTSSPFDRSPSEIARIVEA